MGASTSAQSPGEEVEDAEEKQLQKNGQISISSLNEKTDDQTDLNGHAEEDTLAEIGQTDAMPQKEDSPESIEVLQDDVSPQVNGDQEEDKSISVDKTTSVSEEKVEDKPSESNEVGFKKIFRFVGFKFTLKKDKNEKAEPVQLLTVKETEDGASEAATAEESKEQVVMEEVKPEEESAPDALEKETPTEDAVQAEAVTNLAATDAPPEQQQAEEVETAQGKESAEEVATTPEKEKEAEVQTDSSTSPSQETQSPFKRFFTQGIFSNLRKKTSFKKSKDEEAAKEKPLEEDITEAEERAEEAVAEEKEVKEEAEEEPKSEQVEESAPTEETRAEESPENVPSTTEEQKEEEEKVQVEVTSEAEPPQEAEPVSQTTSEVTEIPVADTVDEAKPINDTKPTEDKPEESVEQAPQSPEIEATTEPELVSSQEKPKAQGSPLKKLFTGAGLKKLSSKKQKSKKEAESKLTESGEQVAEQIQSSTESAEPQKPDSGPSSPEESGEHVVEEISQASQADAAAEGESEAVTSDSEKKKDGIIPWSSFKKLVTPKKRVKRPSESEDEAPADKPKSATLSSTESAAIEDKTEETKPSEELKDEAKEEESQAEPKTETKAEKLEQSTEEPKKKMDTSVSWEALICVGSSKKRARKTSDSDDDETKIEEEVQQSGEEQVKAAESPIVSSQEAEHETLASSPEPEGEPVSTWESFKRLVTHRKKPKAEDKSDEASGPEQTTSDSEAPKEESSFSFRKLIPRRKKKADAKHDPSSDVGSAEEDSDTPAVVPLSEYENEQSEKAETEKKEEHIVEEVEVNPVKASTEDRSPSWISAAVENTEEEADGKQLSDIPEEGDTAATPKSTDNTIAEDIVEFTSEAVTALEQAEETEMVSAVSRITASPVTSGETTPVPGEGVVVMAETVLQEAVGTINVTSSAMAVTVTQEQETVISVSTSQVQVESAIIEEKVVLVPHKKTEASTVCTGLDTSEIKAVEEESPVKASVESVTAVTEVVSVEVAVEDQTPKAVEAGVDEQKVCEAQIGEVQTDYKEQLQTPIENAVEEPAQLESVEETPVAETVHELQATATAVKAAVVTAVQQEAQILEEPLVAENSPKLETEGPIEPSVEESVCAQTVEVTEVAVAEGEKVQELKDVDKSVASVVVASVEGVAMAVSEEITPSLADTPIVEITEAQEEAIPVVAQTEESAVTEEVICECQAIVSITESEVQKEILMEEVLPVESTSEHKVEVAVKEIEIVSAKVEVEGHIEVAASKESAVVQEVCKKVQEEVKLSQAVDVKEVEAIQEQSTVIVQEVIQNVVENLSELCMEKETTEKLVEKETDSSSNAAEESSKPEDKPAASKTTEEKAAVSVPTLEVTPSADVTDQAEKSETEVPVQEEEPAVEAPVQEEKPVDDVPVQEEKPAVEAPVEAEKPAVEAPVQDEKPAVEAPVQDEEPAVEAPVQEQKPVDDVPVQEVKPSVEAPVEAEKPAVEAPVQDEKPAVEAPPVVEEPVEEEKPSAETISEKPLTSDTENKADELKTRVVTEPSLIEVSEAVQISETVPVALTDKIQPEKEETATVSVDAVQQYTDVIKQEVELKKVEKPVEDKTVVESTGSEEGTCQVENDLKEVAEAIQQVTTEKSSEVTQIVTVVCTNQAQVIEEQCQIETTMEINVGIINVVDADGEAATTLKEDCSENQKPVEDKPQTALEESQNEVSTTDVKKGQVGSGDSTCQKTEAKAIEVKMAVEETVNAIKDEVTEEVANDIEPVSTEIATVS